MGKILPDSRFFSLFPHAHLPQGGCKSLVRTIEPGPELAADALGQLGGTEALDGFLGHLPLPLQRDGRRAHPCEALDDLQDEVSEKTQGRLQPQKEPTPLPWGMTSIGAGHEERSPVKAKTPLQSH